MRLRALGGLWVENSDADPGAGPRPRPLALLAFLAAAGATGAGGGASRTHVMRVLWPDADEERARHALSQTLYSLRRDLGGEVVVAGPTLRLDPERITSDVAEFRAAVAARRWAEAAALYAGPFLDHFHLADAPEFERWAEAERASLATAGIRAIEIVAKASAEAGRREEAAEHWHHLTRLDPVDARIAASYMEALAALGDRAAAVAHGRAHAELLRREYETEPDPAVQRLMARLREPHATTPGAPVVPGAPAVSVASRAPRAPESAYSPAAHAPVAHAPPLPVPAPPAAVPPPLPTSPRPARGRLPTLGRVGLAAAAVVAGAALGWRAWTAFRASPPPVLAVGRIRDLVVPDSAAPGAVLGEMLATSLGRLDAVQVVANSRMLELTPRDADTSRTALTDAARRAGATQILEGELIPLPDGQLRLQLRRVDLARGLVRGGYRVAGGDRFALFDSVTALIAADLRVGAPTGSLAEVSTRSPVAYRFYEEGVRAMYQYDAYAANRLFQAAIREDSTFAMATYYAWRMARGIGDGAEWRLAPRALALASRAPPRDRLLIVTHVGGVLAELRARAAAETLATNYPRDPEALVRAAELIEDLPRAVALYDRAIALDSAAGPGGAVLCRLCDALNSLAGRYEWADSGDAALRTLARWQALRPADPMPWAQRASWLTGLGRRAEAEAAARRSEALGGPGVPSHLGALIRDLRLDDLAAADRDCAAGLAGPDSAAFQEYRWYCEIALRMEGRYREARALLREGRVPRSSLRRPPEPNAYMNGIVDMEMGDGLLAAEEFHRVFPLMRDTSRLPDGYRARYATWALTLSATAAVAGGDTLRARRMVDSIEVFGRQSLYSRDPPLHHFVRGLLESRAGRHEAAVRELRAATVSPAFGYTRINYELARSLLALNRPREAIPVVQAPLHGGLEGEQLYLTRTELHELLAHLFDVVGQRDSAAAHYAVVVRAWRSADPFLRPRYEAARAWLARAGRVAVP